MPASQSTFDNIRRAIDNIKPPPEWTWRPNGDTGTFALFHNGEWAGELMLRAGLAPHRAELLDTIVNHLNHLNHPD